MINQKNRKKITLALLRKLGACGDYDGADKGIDYWKKIGSPQSLKKAIRICIESKEQRRLNDANWLICRMMDHKSQILYSAYAAEIALDNFEKLYPDDKRPRLAIEAAKAFAESPTEENKSAARSAWSAAGSAWSAAESAAESAWSAAESAAWSAAWSAWSAAESAAWSAAESAESAARSARSAAWSARSAAWSARSAAWSAWSAAWSAWSADARLDTQIKCLEYGIDLIYGKESK